VLSKSYLDADGRSDVLHKATKSPSPGLQLLPIKSLNTNPWLIMLRAAVGITLISQHDPEILWLEWFFPLATKVFHLLVIGFDLAAQL
jgi:hypothetical protein